MDLVDVVPFQSRKVAEKGQLPPSLSGFEHRPAREHIYKAKTLQLHLIIIRRRKGALVIIYNLQTDTNQLYYYISSGMSLKQQ